VGNQRKDDVTCAHVMCSEHTLAISMGTWEGALETKQTKE
jgi:hypothetical protein